MFTRTFFVATLMLYGTCVQAQDSYTPDHSFASRLKQVQARCAQLESRFDWWYGAPRSAERRDYLTVFIYGSETCKMALQLIKELQEKPSVPVVVSQTPVPLPVARPLPKHKHAHSKLRKRKR